MDFHYTVETDKSIDDAILSLEQHLKERQFGILWQLDLTAKLHEKGVESYKEPYRILEVCNPNEAAKVLGQNELSGYFLPCKIAVYTSKGTTKIGFSRPSGLIQVLGDERLEEIAQTIEMILIEVLDRSK